MNRNGDDAKLRSRIQAEEALAFLVDLFLFFFLLHSSFLSSLILPSPSFHSPPSPLLVSSRRARNRDLIMPACVSVPRGVGRRITIISPASALPWALASECEVGCVSPALDALKMAIQRHSAHSMRTERPRMSTFVDACGSTGPEQSILQGKAYMELYEPVAVLDDMLEYARFSVFEISARLLDLRNSIRNMCSCLVFRRDSNRQCQSLAQARWDSDREIDIKTHYWCRELVYCDQVWRQFSFLRALGIWLTQRAQLSKSPVWTMQVGL
ncbi:hypothetical protein C8J56DRAFT_961163 [Mycena floridula]|nr:hypothetical protein C8J56DRAFT_961163 [Mycena floridula]